MWVLPFDEHSLPDFKAKIPENGEKGGIGVHIAIGKFWQAIQENISENELVKFIPWMRFITRNDWCWAWEVLTVYEVVRREWDKVILRSIYEENDLYGNEEEWEIVVDILWLYENIIAIPGLNHLWSNPLLSFQESTSPKIDNSWVIVPNGISSLMVSSKYNPKYHLLPIVKLVSLFIEKFHTHDILENTPSKIKVRGFSYEKGWLYVDNSVVQITSIALGEWFWFSIKYKYILEEIYKRFFWKKVKIIYSWVKFIESNSEEISAEFLENPIQGIVDEIWRVDTNWKQSENGKFRLFLTNASQNGEKILYLPDEVFFTGFTIEFIE